MIDVSWSASVLQIKQNPACLKQRPGALVPGLFSSLFNVAASQPAQMTTNVPCAFRGDLSRAAATGSMI
jgi:hypothetical protein